MQHEPRNLPGKGPIREILGSCLPQANSWPCLFFLASALLYILERTIFHPSNCERNWADPVRGGSDKRAWELLFVGPLEGLLLETCTADFYVARETRAAGVGHYVLVHTTLVECGRTFQVVYNFECALLPR